MNWQMALSSGKRKKGMVFKSQEKGSKDEVRNNLKWLR